MDLELTGKVALVTGGSRGIGLAVARVLAEEGAVVVIAARGEEALRSAAEQLRAGTGARIEAMVADTSDTASVEAMVARATRELGGIDILVNNAARPGGAPPKPGIENLPDDGFAEEMNTKVLGYVRTARAVTPHMKARGWGRIVNISGLAARQTGNPIGSMRNVAVAALTKNLADELGASGITVNCVHPGLTWTEGVEAMFEGIAARRGETLEAARERSAASNAVRRIVDAGEVAQVVAFLASPKSSAITGESIAAGGGTAGPIHY